MTLKEILQSRISELSHMKGTPELKQEIEQTILTIINIKEK